jgi:glycosyltransferase involved in cell wall biosynthesis
MITALDRSDTRLSLSVALASYNGERYISEQLDSIATQIRIPDELVISDDASTDTTFEIVKDFARHAPFPVRLLRNSERLGSTRNFEIAIQACGGDIIFLCDQDDAWYPAKIALAEECFIDHPEAGAVFSDGDVIDESSGPAGRMWEGFGFTQKEQAKVATGDAWEVLLKHPVVTGTAMAFRARYRELILPLPDLPNTWHDYWISLLIAATSNLAVLAVPLVAYRQHGSNQVGMRRRGKNRGKTLAQIYRPRVVRFEAVRTRLLGCADRYPVDKDMIYHLEEAMEFLLRRCSLPLSRWRRLPGALQELRALRYHRYGYGLKSFRADIFR